MCDTLNAVNTVVFVIMLYLDYSRTLILLANFKAHLLLGLSLPYSAIPPAAAGVVPRLRESTSITRNVGLFSFGNFTTLIYCIYVCL